MINIRHASKVCTWFLQFLVYDTQLIIGGRRHEISAEEYIYGALQLYVDIVYIFLIILNLVGRS